MLIFAPIEQYYKNKLIYGLEEYEDSYLNSFVVKYWEIWKAKRTKSAIPLPQTLDGVKILTLNMFKEKYTNSGLHPDYLKKLDNEIARLEALEPKAA